MFLDVHTDVVDLVCRGFMRFHEVMCETGKRIKNTCFPGKPRDRRISSSTVLQFNATASQMNVVSVMLINTSIRAQ